MQRRNARGALPDQRLDRVDFDRQRVARLGAFDPDRAGLRIAKGDLLAVAAVGIGANLAAEGILALHDDGSTTMDSPG
jgi:hypothetical protein